MKIKIILSIFLWLLLSTGTVFAGTVNASGSPDLTPSVSIDNTIRLATTTSTENSGLLGFLLPEFEKTSAYHVHIIAVGTGKALRMGKDGDVDALLVHALEAEKEFVANAYGVKRYSVMYNDFIILGPAADPAAIQNAPSLQDAFLKIYKNNSVFISRGDDSGTHKKEKKIWASVDLLPEGRWYREIGQGMGKAIQMANELGAYTIADHGTWLSYKDKTELKILYQGDKSLFNPYGIIAVNPKRYADINYKGATALIDWMTSKRGQHLIGQYKIDQQVLFTPAAE